MNHKQTQYLFHQALTGELTAKLRFKFEGHLSKCDECSTAFAEFEQTLRAAKTISEETFAPLGPRFTASVMEKLEGYPQYNERGLFMRIRRVFGKAMRIAVYSSLCATAAIVAVLFTGKEASKSFSGVGYSIAAGNIGSKYTNSYSEAHYDDSSARGAELAQLQRDKTEKDQVTSGVLGKITETLEDQTRSLDESSNKLASQKQRTIGAKLPEAVQPFGFDPRSSVSDSAIAANTGTKVSSFGILPNDFLQFGRHNWPDASANSQMVNSFSEGSEVVSYIGSPMVAPPPDSKRSFFYINNGYCDGCNVPMLLPTTSSNTEEYAHNAVNDFLDATKNPLSTFSIDVDTASYANTRRYLTSGALPPPDAVRIEEFVNYFHYNYPAPDGDVPFSINTELATAPWKPSHKLLRVGIRGRDVSRENAQPSNLVFLVDVSGSMNEPDKLPLVKRSLEMLSDQLRERDRVSIVVYAGNAGLVLPSTPGSNKRAIIEAIERLEAGGSTAGGAGISLAYEIARANMVRDGNNRVILATDGDFNVGVSSDAELTRLIEEKRDQGIFLTVLGFGTGNYKDAKMEQLADKGNGNYAYIDNILEARKVLVRELTGTLYTIAKDVKIQVEFNPANVKSYKLIGYENRMLAKEDFNNDKKDAGELGAGHTVTALYEIITTGSKDDDSATGSVDPLKYQSSSSSSAPAPVTNPEFTSELLTVKLRYKEPKGDISKLLTQTVQNGNRTTSEASEDFRFATAVAEFGMILGNQSNDLRFDDIAALGRTALGKDENGDRAEFLKLVSLAQQLKR